MSRSSTAVKATVLPPFHGTNLFFVRCLTELKAEAEESGSKTVYTYAKAISSLLKYPSKLASGKESEAINGIGVKTAEYLEKKLAEYRLNFGEPDPAEFEDCVPVAARKRLKRAKKPNVSPNSSRAGGGGKVMAKKACRRSGEYIPQPGSGSCAILVALHQHHINPAATGSALTKEQLIGLAQPLCEASFTIPDPKTKYYTAWACMATLLTKGMVEKRSCPAKFSLTDAGLELAARLATASTSADSPPKIVKLTPATISSCSPNSLKSKPDSGFAKSAKIVGNVHNVVEIEPEIDTIKPDSSHRRLVNRAPQFDMDSCRIHPTNLLDMESNCAVDSAGHPRQVQSSSSGPSSKSSNANIPIATTSRPNVSDYYVYISPEGRETVSKQDAMFIFDGAGCYCLLKVPKQGLVAHPNKFKSLPQDFLTPIPKVDWNKDHYSLAMVDEIDADDFAPGIEDALTMSDDEIHVIPAVEPDSGPYSISTHLDKYKYSKIKPVPLSVSNGNHLDRPKSPIPSSKTIEPSRDICRSSIAENLDDNILDWTLNDKLDFPTTGGTSDAKSNNTKESAVSSSTHSGVSVDSFTLRPGKFRILLCVDNQEAIGGPACARKAKLEQTLRQMQVPFDRRKLNVGDFCWVAQEIRPYNQPEPMCREGGAVKARPDGPPACRELVLDCIVERKRIDDLAASMIDKRYYEQKLRLKQCGLRRVIYLVEDFGGKTEQLPIPRATLEKAIENTRVQDEFCVHRTESIEDSVAYFCSFTAYLEEVFKLKTLTSCSRNEIPKEQPVDFSNERMSLMTFEEFQKFSIKDAPVSVRVFFGRQLMQIKGVSAEKARLITHAYPTLRSLLDAYNSCTSETERESLLRTMKSCPTSQSFGIALSRKLFNFYCHSGNFDN